MTSAQQKAARRKKRTSKHVLKAKEERKQQQETDNNDETTRNTQSNKVKKKRKKQHHVKDPNEAASYLSAWKHARGAWKFNKNTQSWLLRHQYQPEKVSKGTFSILLEYMQGLQGQTRTRTFADAKSRANRYKEYEKSNPPNESDEDKKKDSSSKEPVEDEDDDTRWKRLDDHEKRKEYKRARKVLDALARDEQEE